MFVLLVANIDDDVNAVWAILGLSSIFLYSYSFYSSIPASLSKKKPFRSYLGKTILALIISFLPLMLLAMLLAQNEEDGTLIAVFNVPFQLVIIAPLSWILFKRQMKGNEELYFLKT
jgi:two-component system, LytTR family, sensor kinase